MLLLFLLAMIGAWPLRPYLPAVIDRYFSLYVYAIGELGGTIIVALACFFALWHLTLSFVRGNPQLQFFLELLAGPVVLVLLWPPYFP